MEYRILRIVRVSGNIDEGLNSMEELVNQALSEGWQVVSSLSVTTRYDDIIYILQPVQRPRPVEGNNRTTFLNNLNRVRG